MVAQRAPAQKCPLCGQAVPAGGGLEALGDHFQRCPNTESTRFKQTTDLMRPRPRAEKE